MKKHFLNLRLVIIIVFLTILNLQCTKEKATDEFCAIQRSEVLQASNDEAIIGYYQKYNRWAIYTIADTAGNIDSRIIGLTCDIPTNMQVDGLPVTFSGTFKKFNADENITPQIGGDDLYYLTLSQITKKP